MCQEVEADSQASMTKNSVAMELRRVLSREVDVDALEAAANEARSSGSGDTASGKLDRKARRMLEIAKRG